MCKSSAILHLIPHFPIFLCEIVDRQTDGQIYTLWLVVKKMAIPTISCHHFLT